MLTLDLAAPTSPTIADTASASPADVAANLDPRFALVPLQGRLWRVTRADGEVLGYVEEFDAEGGARYRAKRVNARLRRFIPVGEFWRFGDAVDCFVGS